jgi:type II secretion system protein G
MIGRVNRKKNEKGFTLIEILIVVVIVAILAAISVPIYVEYVKSARASDAKTSIQAIYQAAQVYYQERGQYPSSLDELEQGKYVEIQGSTKLQWQFQIIGQPPTEITATSTEQMKGGAGNQVIYQVVDGTWHGYGQPDEAGGTQG